MIDRTIDLYKQLLNKYGDKQIVVAIEELSELQKELCKHLRGKTDKKAILEEWADVWIVLQQIKLYYNLSSEDLKNEID